MDIELTDETWDEMRERMNREIEKSAFNNLRLAQDPEELRDLIFDWEIENEKDRTLKLLIIGLMNDLKFLKELLEEELGPKKSHELLAKMELKKHGAKNFRRKTERIKKS
ncbi:hypothetical protein V7124_19480 [Neobacillus niacini]|uniref:hypothetical protein n=1 Tax=Neobacillus niacini TaxID=86668 RepID=UPI002FFF4BD0